MTWKMAVIGVAIVATIAAGRASASEPVTCAYDAKGMIGQISHGDTAINSVSKNQANDKVENCNKGKVTSAP